MKVFKQVIVNGHELRVTFDAEIIKMGWLTRNHLIEIVNKKTVLYRGVGSKVHPTKSLKEVIEEIVKNTEQYTFRIDEIDEIKAELDMWDGVINFK
ncbi:hypothetical protein [Bacillus pumilus]|uniref:hypothetical protein n=1 Tax=Bacillus pumilus TaxID=1408 RepID=UPI0011A072EE|nr:hypothetical protein [Bacillus pumilus]